MGKENEQIASILSYFIVGIIWFFVDNNLKKNKKVKFHVKQALNLIVVSVILGIIFSLVNVLTFGLLYFLYVLVRIALFVLWFVGLVNAINLKQKEIPFIGHFAEMYLTF